MEINKLTGRGPAVNPAVPSPARNDAPTQTAGTKPTVPYDAARVNQSDDVKKSAVSEADLKHSIEAINRFLKPVTGNIQFSQDEDTGRTLVKIVDTESNTVLRQIPTEEAVAIAKQLDKLQGLLVREKA
jgi:flagellar protein FlaG